MGLTIHWSFQGPQKKSEATAIIEKMRQRAMDLPFESVGDIVHFKGEERPIRQRSTRLAVPLVQDSGRRDHLDPRWQDRMGLSCPRDHRLPGQRGPRQRMDGDLLGDLSQDNPDRG